MRFSTLVLFLYAAPAAFCQFATPPAANPGQQWTLPPQFTQPGSNFRNLPPNWGTLNVLPRKRIIPPRVDADSLRSNRQIDREMIVRPPRSSLGEQAPGTLVARNL